ncbi:aminotransferase class V-fold PLP-dependent enzyme [Candidatus Gracilibacteria bacterium]|nr:aminotransferase class V-fold PLP-dependent enzyme [Candidatus Gracilibacteria bacterium]
MFDLKAFQNQFPILREKIHGHPLAYLDNAATTQKPQVVIDAIVNYYTKQNANVHRGVHQLSELATDAYEQARITVAKFINAAHPEEIIFTSGTTESINLVASNFGPEHKIAFSHLEHHANIVPWQQTGARLTVFDPTNPELPKDLDLLAITGMSNVTGEKPQIPQTKALKLIDAAQLIAHEKIDVQKLNCDFLAFSGHKILGPTGIGVLYAKKEHLEKMHPYQTGGGMIKIVNETSSTFADLPAKFEAGTPNIEGAIALAAAIKFIEQIDHQSAHQHLQNLITQTHQILNKYPQIQLHSAPNSPIISFTTTSAHPHDIASILDNEGVAIRAGHHCCQLLMHKLQTPATSRISLYYYNSEQDLEQLDRGLQKVFKTFNF